MSYVVKGNFPVKRVLAIIQGDVINSARETEFRDPGTATSERELAIDCALERRKDRDAPVLTSGSG